MGSEKIILRWPLCFRGKKNMKKTKSFGSVQKWGFERRGEGSYGIQSQGGQELTDAAAAAPLTTQKTPWFTLHGVQQDFMLDMHVRVGM